MEFRDPRKLNLKLTFSLGLSGTKIEILERHISKLLAEHNQDATSYGNLVGTSVDLEKSQLFLSLGVSDLEDYYLTIWLLALGEELKEINFTCLTSTVHSDPEDTRINILTPLEEYTYFPEKAVLGGKILT